MLRQRRETDARAHAAGLVQQAVVEFETGGEAAVVGVGVWGWGCRCRGGGGSWSVGSRWRRRRGLRGVRRRSKRETGIGPEIIKPPDAEESAVGAVQILGAVLGDVVLEEGEDGAAAFEAGVADAGELELLGGREASEVEGFDRGLGEVEAAVEEGVCVVVISGWVLLVWELATGMGMGRERPLRSTCC